MEAITGERIKSNVQNVTERIHRAAESVGRKPESVQLLIVTKLQPVEVIEEAMACGARLFGENYAEDAIPKIQSLQNEKSLEWHMIGHVQSRKAQMVCQYFDMVESIDSLKLAERIERFCAETQCKIRVLLEFNLGGEEKKSGWVVKNEDDLNDLLPEIIQITSFQHIQVEGLMTMPPLFEQPEHARPYFQQLVKMQRFLRKRLSQACWDVLSMGTSQDFEIAVQEGATIVRIGRADFGPSTRALKSGIDLLYDVGRLAWLTWLTLFTYYSRFCH